jgi:uncharacterized protein
MKLHPKIKELKLRAAPITYSSTVVDRNGNLQSLLDKRQVEGYGVIWGDINMYRERFHKGAFARSIRENGPGSGAAYELKLTDEHGRALCLFEELREDDIGLYFRSKPFDLVPWAEDVLTQLRSGTLNNFSIGFNYDFNEGSMMWNDVDEVIDMYQSRLLEIGVVAVPADLGTYALRNADDEEQLFEDTEELIQSLPRKKRLEVRKLIARHKSLSSSEALDEKLNALKDAKPVENRGIPYNYLITNF